MSQCYTVTQAADMTGVKSSVLRYWEEELNLHIGRNELGHRCYTQYDIQLFMNIKELKNRGLQLRAIKELIPKIAQTAPGSTQSKMKLLGGEEIQEKEAAAKTAADTAAEAEGETLDEDEKILEFQQILERLIAQEMRLKNQEEARCHSLDEAIRRRQQARKEAAATSERKEKRYQSRTGKR